MDVMPGIYTPDVYRQRLEQFRLLSLYARRYHDTPQARANTAAARLKEYHQRQAEALRKNQPAEVLAIVPDARKAAIEMSVKLVAAPAVPKGTASKPVAAAAGLAGWQPLVDDTRHNETVRRAQIHAKLAETGMVRPEAMVKWLYKDVLHA